MELFSLHNFNIRSFVRK